MEFTPKEFNQIKGEAENFYNGIQKVRCPYFQSDIHFNSKGWEHLIFKEWNKTRLISDQYSRLRHIKLAPEIIQSSKTLLGVWTTQKFERVKKKDGTWQKILKLTIYYEFIAVMESHGSKVRVKVIVKQVDGGERYFLSIIPFWGTNKQGDRVMHSGNPEND
jgi:conjugative element/phage-associated large polyvalent protein